MDSQNQWDILLVTDTILNPSWWWKILDTNPPASKRTPNEKG